MEIRVDLCWYTSRQSQYAFLSRLFNRWKSWLEVSRQFAHWSSVVAVSEWQRVLSSFSLLKLVRQMAGSHLGPATANTRGYFFLFWWSFFPTYNRNRLHPFSRSRLALAHQHSIYILFSEGLDSATYLGPTPWKNNDVVPCQDSGGVSYLIESNLGRFERRFLSRVCVSKKKEGGISEGKRKIKPKQRSDVQEQEERAKGNEAIFTKEEEEEDAIEGSSKIQPVVVKLTDDINSLSLSPLLSSRLAPQYKMLCEHRFTVGDPMANLYSSFESIFLRAPGLRGHQWRA